MLLGACSITPHRSSNARPETASCTRPCNPHILCSRIPHKTIKSKNKLTLRFGTRACVYAGVRECYLVLVLSPLTDHPRRPIDNSLHSLTLSCLRLFRTTDMRCLSIVKFTFGKHGVAWMVALSLLVLAVIEPTGYKPLRGKQCWWVKKKMEYDR